MNVMMLGHQGKEDGLARALNACGHTFVQNPDQADCLFVDHDDPGFGPRRALLEMFRERGKATFMYPHGAGIMLSWDGLIEPFPVTAHFTIGEGQREVMRRYKYPAATVAAGWSLCLQRPFVPVAKVKRVLFAPIHPPSNPDFPPFPEHTAANQAAFHACRSLDAELTVRCIGTPQANGLPDIDPVVYVQGDYDNSVAEIDEADLVVGCDTFASLAVARGKPVVQFGQDINSRGEQGDRPQVKHWADYKDYMRYPFDITDGPMSDVAAAAAVGSPEADEWRQLFVGEPLKPQAFGRIVEQLAGV